MPATYKGNSANNTTAVAWTALTAHSQGDLVRPSPGTGQVFLCTVAGTTGSSQPSWSSAPFPTLGTTFSGDGSVTWMCYGTEPGPWPPVIQQPVDADPPLAFAQVTPEQTITDQVAWLTQYAALLNEANTWAQVQTFTSGWVANSTCTLNNADLYFFSYTNSSPVLWFDASPASATRLWIYDVDLGPYSAHLWADNVGVLQNHSALTWTANAIWNGSNWVQSSGSYQSSFMQLGDRAWVLSNITAGGTYPTDFTEWVDISMEAGGEFAAFGLPLYAQAGANVSGGDLGVTGNVNATGSIGAGGAVTGATVTAGIVEATSSLQGLNLQLLGDVTQVGGISTKGIGVPICIAAVTTSVNIASTSPGSSYTNIFSTAVPVGSTFYELKLWFFLSGSGVITAANFDFKMVLSSDYPSGKFPQNDNSHAALIWADGAQTQAAAIIPFSPSANQTFQFAVNYSGGGAVNVLALLFQLY